MKSTVFNPAQMQLLEMMSYVKSEKAFIHSLMIHRI